MANYAVLKAAVEEVVKANGNEEITGTNLQSTLISIINSLGSGYQFMGVATPSTTPPSSPDYNIAYIGGAGTYDNFGTSITVNVGSICVFKWNGTWTKEQIKMFEGIDEEPSAGSDNLVISGSIFTFVENIDGNLRGDLLGNYLDISTIKSGYYNLTLHTFHYQNYHAIVDVSSVKGKHLTAVTAGSVSQWAFFIDCDNTHCVLATESGNYTPFGSHVEVPANANYLYLYLGTQQASAVKPTLVVDESDVRGIVQDRTAAPIRGIKPVIGCFLSFSNKRWSFQENNQQKYKYIIVPVSPYDAISMKRGTETGIYAIFLKDYYIPNPPFTYVNGQAFFDASALISDDANASIAGADAFDGSVPVDARYLYILLDSNSDTYKYLPSFISINGEAVTFDFEKVGMVGFGKVSDTEFYLTKKQNGNTLTYEWTHLNWESQANGHTVTDQDCWNNMDLRVNGLRYGQTNINFIHMFTGTTLHTGNAHGCTVDTLFDIFIDGEKIDFSNLANGSVIWGKDIYIIQQSDGYLPSAQRTTDNGGDGNKVYCEVDASGNPVQAVRWCLDYHFTYDKEYYINKLFILRDNISFNRCYGAMNCIFPVSNSHTLVVNDSEGTVNTYVRENGAWTVTAEHGVNLKDLTAEQLHGATKVVQFGDDFRIETECINDEHPTFGRLRPWFDTDGAGGRVKLYLTPINVAQAEGSTPADVFNNGDVISCHVLRNVSAI